MVAHWKADSVWYASGGGAHLRPDGKLRQQGPPLQRRPHREGRRSHVVQHGGGARRPPGTHACDRLRQREGADDGVGGRREAHPHRHGPPPPPGQAGALRDARALEQQRVCAGCVWGEHEEGPRRCKGDFASPVLRPLRPPPAHPQGTGDRHQRACLGGGGAEDRARGGELHLFRKHQARFQVGLFRAHSLLRFQQARQDGPLRGVFRHTVGAEACQVRQETHDNQGVRRVLRPRHAHRRPWCLHFDSVQLDWGAGRQQVHQHRASEPFHDRHARHCSERRCGLRLAILEQGVEAHVDRLWVRQRVAPQKGRKGGCVARRRGPFEQHRGLRQAAQGQNDGGSNLVCGCL
mmetsp:Transcript_32780/g.76569  ORF Transcript_32780/g.76569 Transcript_32780/m.76569 type:complete len:349 (+) Transcript_32780:592-1638(+)